MDQIVGPFDAGAESGGGFHRVAHGNGCGTGQVHQITGGAVRTKEDAHINALPLRGEEASAHPPVTGSLMSGHKHRTMGCSLTCQGFQPVIGGIDGGEAVEQLFPGVSGRKPGQDLFFHISQCPAPLPQEDYPEFPDAVEYFYSA